MNNFSKKIEHFYRMSNKFSTETKLLTEIIRAARKMKQNVENLENFFESLLNVSFDLDADEKLF